MDEAPKLLTAQEVAEIMKISESQAYTLMREEMQTIKVGRNRRVRWEVLLEYLESKETCPANPVYAKISGE